MAKRRIQLPLRVAIWLSPAAFDNEDEHKGKAFGLVQGHRQEMKDAKDRHSNLLRYRRKLEVSELSDRPGFPTIAISLAFVAFDPRLQGRGCPEEPMRK